MELVEIGFVLAEEDEVEIVRVFEVKIGEIVRIDYGFKRF
jgi:hypothetical protein